MNAKATRDLTQLSEGDFCFAVAEGLRLVIENVNRLHDAAIALTESDHHHGSRVLSGIAEEEASKVLILLDAVRCPRNPADRLSRQLGRFSNHLAKGLYTKACMYRPGTLAELQQYINSDRGAFYLDGPNDCDWILRNEIMQSREGQLYVDYVGRDENHSWSDPALLSKVFGSRSKPASITMAQALFDVGISTPDAVSTVAEFWRSTPPNCETPWAIMRQMNHATLQLLEQRGQLIEQATETYSRIVHYWQFPMFDLDLSLIEVKQETLRGQQRSWTSDDY